MTLLSKGIRGQLIGNPSLYAVAYPGSECYVDPENNIIDIYYKTAMRYTIDEAEDLLITMHTAFDDYADDLYYGAGPDHYPIRLLSGPVPEAEFEYHNGLILYRYTLAGEWIYGITNKAKDRYIEASMSGWERWLKDRKAILHDKWMAANGYNLD